MQEVAFKPLGEAASEYYLHNHSKLLKAQGLQWGYPRL